MVARVVASMRANGCSHTVTLYFESFFKCYLLIFRILMDDNSYFVDWKCLITTWKNRWTETTDTVELIQSYGRSNSINRCFRKFPMLETRVSNWWNFSSKPQKLWFQALETLVPSLRRIIICFVHSFIITPICLLLCNFDDAEWKWLQWLYLN